MKTQSRDTHLDVEAAQVRSLAQRGPAGRFALLRSLTRSTIDWSRRTARRLHPEKRPSEISQQLIELCYGASLANQIELQHLEREMSPPEILLAVGPVCDAFELLHVPYYVGGSVASSVHGIPRSTLNADLVADLRLEHARHLVRQLEGGYYVSAPMIREAIRRRSSFNVLHFSTSFKVDVFIPGDRPLDREAFLRVQRQSLDTGEPARTFPFASPEDVVVSKLEWYRLGKEVSERHRKDVQGVLKVQGDRLDRALLRRLASEAMVEDLLRRAWEDAS